MSTTTGTVGATTRAEYRGPDRRLPVQHGLVRHRSPIAGGVAAITVGVVIGLAAARATAEGHLAGTSADLLVDVAAVALSVHVAVAGWTYGRATGEAIGFRLAGIAGLLATALLGEIAGADPVVRTTALLLGAGWAIWIVRGPVVERRDHLRIAGIGSAAGIVLAAAIAAASSTASQPLRPVTAVPLAALWLGVGVVLARTARRERLELPGWLAWTAAAVGLAELSAAWSSPTDLAWSLAAGLRLGGASAAAVGIAHALAVHVSGRREQALRFRAELLEARRHDRETLQDREHEVGNALFAIEGAALTLSRHADRLDERTGRELATSIITGVERLRALHAEPTTSSVPASTVTAVAEERARSARQRGVAVTVTGDPDLRAAIAPGVLGQVLDNLLLNAVRHAGAGPDAPVGVDASVEAGRVVLRVVDQGPGVPDHARETVFERGTRLDGRTPGQGLGLYLARRQVRDAGGDLLVDGDHRDGACFVTLLPLALPGAGDGHG